MKQLTKIWLVNSIEMQIKAAVDAIVSVPNSWVRVEQVRRVSNGLELVFGVYKGRRGRKIQVWEVLCSGVHEAKFTDMDGGGLAVYASNHPAARQYTAKQAELRWSHIVDEDQVFIALYRAHVNETDDWISFENYLPIETPWNGTSSRPYFASTSGKRIVCRGPDFLLRAYAKALEAVGEKVKLTIRETAKPRPVRPKVLHFGDSYVVANKFEAQLAD